MPGTTELKVERLSICIRPNPSRVIVRPFIPDDERICHIIDRVLGLSELEVKKLTKQLQKSFHGRHRYIIEELIDNFETVREHVADPGALSLRRKLLIGAYFTMEYAVEAAALFNPSMVPTLDQSGLAKGSTRFLMSLRAVGEGHISSIVFRRGVIDSQNNISIEPTSPISYQLEVARDVAYEKNLFRQKLIEMGAYNDVTENILELLPNLLRLADVKKGVEQARQCSGTDDTNMINQAAENMLWVARSNYTLRASKGVDPSEIVIFPTSETESQGIEDVRLVRFVDDNGSMRYFGIYTAHNGQAIMPQLMEARLEDSGDSRIDIHTMSGSYARNKGMALFPRKINGRYAMISRLDNENLFLMYSDSVQHWDEAVVLQRPKFAWEFVQVGNCGSPLETDAGWLLLTHGVGPMRQYSIGATLLDLRDPSRIIGQTKKPLLIPTEEERSGYVPNVVYSCGSMIHGDALIIPYAISDTATKFASISLNDLLKYLKDVAQK
jgi:predicted GH43/DUF377 family glycosyl hydrolase